MLLVLTVRIYHDAGQQNIKNPVISLFFETSRRALGGHPTSYAMCIVRYLLRAHLQGHEADRSPPSGVEINNVLNFHSPKRRHGAVRNSAKEVYLNNYKYQGR